MYDLFSDFAGFFDGFDVYPVYRQEARCKKCGRTYSDFQKSGRLGCGECYEAFAAPIDVTLKRIHASSEHKGKIPVSAGSGISKKRKIENLKAEIAKAVASEDYEKAAALHKELKGIDG